MNQFQDYKNDLTCNTYYIQLKDQTINLKFDKANFPHLIGLQYIYPNIKSKEHIENLDNRKNKLLYSNQSITETSGYLKSKYKILGFKYVKDIFKECDMYYFKDGVNINNLKMDYILTKKIYNLEINLGIIYNSSLQQYYPTTLLVNTNPNHFDKFTTKGEKVEAISIVKVDNYTNEKTTIHLSNNEPSDIKSDLAHYNITAPNCIVEAIQNLNAEYGQVLSIKQISYMYKSDKLKDVKNPLLQSIGKYFETEQQNKLIQNSAKFELKPKSISAKHMQPEP